MTAQPESPLASDPNIDEMVRVFRSHIDSLTLADAAAYVRGTQTVCVAATSRLTALMAADPEHVDAYAKALEAVRSSVDAANEFYELVGKRVSA